MKKSVPNSAGVDQHECYRWYIFSLVRQYIPEQGYELDVSQNRERNSRYMSIKIN